LKAARESENADEQEDIDFVGQAETGKAGSMEHLNLFGVPLSEVDQLDFGKDQEETVKEKN